MNAKIYFALTLLALTTTSTLFGGEKSGGGQFPAPSAFAAVFSHVDLDTELGVKALSSKLNQADLKALRTLAAEGLTEGKILEFRSLAISLKSKEETRAYKRLVVCLSSNSPTDMFSRFEKFRKKVKQAEVRLLESSSCDIDDLKEDYEERAWEPNVPFGAETKRLFTQGDAQSSPCNLGIAVRLQPLYAGNFQLRVWNIMRDVESCDSDPHLQRLSANVRHYSVKPESVTTDDRKVTHYSSQSTEGAPVQLNDFSKSPFPAPQFAKWTFWENEKTYYGN